MEWGQFDQGTLVTYLLFKKHPEIFNDHQQSKPQLSLCLYLVLNLFWVIWWQLVSWDKSLSQDTAGSLISGLHIPLIKSGWHFMFASAKRQVVTLLLTAHYTKYTQVYQIYCKHAVLNEMLIVILAPIYNIFWMNFTWSASFNAVVNPRHSTQSCACICSVMSSYIQYKCGYSIYTFSYATLSAKDASLMD